MQSRRLHRLSRFRRNKRRLRDRLRQRIFFGEDKETLKRWKNREWWC
jgi:NAD-dependent deacetylase